MEAITKLSINDFKKKVKADSKNDLSKIAGGVLGACHCVSYATQYYSSTGTSTSVSNSYYN